MAKNMKNQKYPVHYDKKEDILYFGVHSGAEEEFIEVAPGVSVELDKNGKVMGIEVLNASEILKPVFKPNQRQNQMFGVVQ